MNDRLRRGLKAAARPLFAPLLNYLALKDNCSPAVKVAQRHLFNYYQRELSSGKRWRLRDTGFRNYSMHEEDGMLLYIFAAVGMGRRLFADIGAGNGLANNNCANLAINFGWHGLFIDAHRGRIDSGRAYYHKQKDTKLFPPLFVDAFVKRENINEIIADQGIKGEIDLLSIDIDGNDYWIWEALSVIQPRVVVIEIRVEFGLRQIVVPYDAAYQTPDDNPDYGGASLAAMTSLARAKGYRLVGANGYGFNAFYVKNGCGDDILPEVSVESILSHPRNLERAKRFDAIGDREHVEG